MPPAAKTNSGLKVLFIVLGVLGVLGMMAIGGIWYGFHKVRQAAASKGIDLSSLAETPRGPGRRYDACELLSKEDLSRILNLPIERTEGGGRSTHSDCRYYSAEAQQRASDEASEAMKKIQEEAKAGANSPDQAEQMKAMQNMIRGITGAAAGAQGGALLSIEVNGQGGKAAMTAFKLAMGLTTGAISGGDEKTQKMLREEIHGVGDEAMFGPMLSLFMFRQGDVSVQIDARTLPGGREAILNIAKVVSAKL